MVSGALVLVHAAGLLVLGTSPAGSFFSDSMQLILGIVLLVVVFHAAIRSHGLARSFWYLTAFSYCAWIVPQALSTYGDRFDTPELTQSTIKFLFSFWLLPMSMTLCLDEDSKRGGLDWLLILDFCQGFLFLFAAHSYFHFNSGFEPSLAPPVWIAYFLWYGLLAGAFLLRSILAHSVVARMLFRRLAFFLLFSAAVDALYYYGSGSLLQTGSRFDIFWSILLVYPLLMAASWNDNDWPEADENPGAQARGRLLGRVPGLVFPLFIFLMAVHISQTRVLLASGLVIASFACSSVKHVLTQHQLVEAQDFLRRQASHDGLTGAWNHVGVMAILEREILRAERERELVGIMMIDVDHFKSVNDKYGHGGGDAVLRALVQQFATVLRPYDSLGRYGGEEFMIVVPGCGIEKTRELAERIRLSIASHPIAFNDNTISVTVSIGVAAYGSGSSVESLLRKADEGLYLAKNRGRNRVELEHNVKGTPEQSVTVSATCGTSV